jgi:hypothetical protein
VDKDSFYDIVRNKYDRKIYHVSTMPNPVLGYWETAVFSDPGPAFGGAVKRGDTILTPEFVRKGSVSGAEGEGLADLARRGPKGAHKLVRSRVANEDPSKWVMTSDELERHKQFVLDFMDRREASGINQEDRTQQERGTGASGRHMPSVATTGDPAHNDTQLVVAALKRIVVEPYRIDDRVPGYVLSIDPQLQPGLTIEWTNPPGPNQYAALVSRGSLPLGMARFTWPKIADERALAFKMAEWLLQATGRMRSEFKVEVLPQDRLGPFGLRRVRFITGHNGFGYCELVVFPEDAAGISNERGHFPLNEHMSDKEALMAMLVMQDLAEAEHGRFQLKIAESLRQALDKRDWEQVGHAADSLVLSDDEMRQLSADAQQKSEPWRRGSASTVDEIPDLAHGGATAVLGSGPVAFVIEEIMARQELIVASNRRFQFKTVESLRQAIRDSSWDEVQHIAETLVLVGAEIERRFQPVQSP